MNDSKSCRNALSNPLGFSPSSFLSLISVLLNQDLLETVKTIVWFLHWYTQVTSSDYPLFELCFFWYIKSNNKSWEMYTKQISVFSFMVYIVQSRPRLNTTLVWSVKVNQYKEDWYIPQFGWYKVLSFIRPRESTCLHRS